MPIFYANIKCGSEVTLELVQYINKNFERNIDLANPPLCPHIAMETDDFDNVSKQLQKKSIKIFDGPHVISGDVKILTILDPDHYRIDIGQLLK